MKTASILSIVSIFAISCTALPETGFAGDKPNLLIVGEDYDEDTIPRNNRIFKRVMNAFTNEMHNEGFDVFDETAITLGKFGPGRIRRNDAEVIGIAKLQTRPPLDVLVITKIYASMQKLSYTTKVKARVTGRMLSVQSGQNLGNFEVESPGTWVAPLNCTKECKLETVGKYAKILGKEVAGVLAGQLDHLLSAQNSEPADAKSGGLPSHYNLVFEGFTPDDMMEIEEYLVIFSGYKTHRAVYTGYRRHEFWYESHIGTAKLDRNLKKMLTHIDLKGRVSFDISDNEYTVTKITRRKIRKIDKNKW
jgi:hypothetical protein